jgi:hypothetical protein
VVLGAPLHGASLPEGIGTGAIYYIYWWCHVCVQMTTRETASMMDDMRSMALMNGGSEVMFRSQSCLISVVQTCSP